MLIVISSLSQFHFVNFYSCIVYYLFMLYFLPPRRIKSLIYKTINRIIINIIDVDLNISSPNALTT